MERLSFLDKLAVLGSNILAHPIFILLLLSPIVIFVLNKKITRKIVIAIYVLILAIVLFVGNSTIFELLDNLIDGIFMTVYFPNFVTLFVVVVASAIIALITFLKKKMFKANKIINITGFAIVQTMFCLVLTVVQVNNIDIYEENALYSNSDVLTLMQLLTGTFALQIISIIVVTAIEKITKMLDDKDEAHRKYRNIERAKKLTSAKAETLFMDDIEDDYDIKIEPQAPLDKSLIEQNKITPISLLEAIDEEKRQNNAIVSSPPEFELPVETLNVKPKVEPETLEIPEVQKPLITPELEAPRMPKFVAEVVNTPAAKVNKEEILPEIPKAVNAETLMPKTPEIKVKEERPVIKEIPKSEPEEVITGLVIMNLAKTISAIKNIKRIYTM